MLSMERSPQLLISCTKPVSLVFSRELIPQLLLRCFLPVFKTLVPWGTYTGAPFMLISGVSVWYQTHVEHYGTFCSTKTPWQSFSVMLGSSCRNILNIFSKPENLEKHIGSPLNIVYFLYFLNTFVFNLAKRVQICFLITKNIRNDRRWEFLNIFLVVSDCQF